jgi:hypothetical protein
MNFPTPQLLERLASAYEALIQRTHAADEDSDRLHTIVADFTWYAQRLGSDRWDAPPRPGRWSFQENLQHIVEQAVQLVTSEEAPSIIYVIDHAKEHVGQAAEIYALFFYG